MKSQTQKQPRRWPDADKVYLKNHYHNTDIEVLIKKIGRPAKTIHQMANRLGITGKRYSVNNYNSGRAAKPKTELKKAKEKSRNPNRWDRRKIKVKEFNSDGLKLVRVDKKTSVYVSVNATEKEIAAIISRYSQSA